MSRRYLHQDIFEKEIVCLAWNLEVPFFYFKVKLINYT